MKLNFRKKHGKVDQLAAVVFISIQMYGQIFILYTLKSAYHEKQLLRMNSADKNIENTMKIPCQYIFFKSIEQWNIFIFTHHTWCSRIIISRYTNFFKCQLFRIWSSSMCVCMSQWRIKFEHHHQRRDWIDNKYNT